MTNLPAKGFDRDPDSLDRFGAQKCYEKLYCARGDMENQIKQQYLDLEADRTSTHWMASNQLRLWFSAFALLLIQRLRTLALRGTKLAKATAGTIRQRLLKIGAMVTVSTRRVYVRLASAFPLQSLFAQAHRADKRSLFPSGSDELTSQVTAHQRSYPCRKMARSLDEPRTFGFSAGVVGLAMAKGPKPTRIQCRIVSH